MKRSTQIIIAAVVAAALAGAYLLSRSPESTSPAPVSSALDTTPAAPDLPVGDSCSVECSGNTVEILCAEGETPQCDCSVVPQAQCLPPATP